MHTKGCTKFNLKYCNLTLVFIITGGALQNIQHCSSTCALMTGNTIEQHCAAIGVFFYISYRCTYKSISFKCLFRLFFDYLKCCRLSWYNCFTSIQTNFVLIYHCIQIIYILLLLCGDIESNPGPKDQNIYTLHILHLNVRSIRNKTFRIWYFMFHWDESWRKYFRQRFLALFFEKIETVLVVESWYMYLIHRRQWDART